MVPKLILITGNIGVGKSTFIKNYVKDHPNAVPLYENLEDWGPYIKKYYEIMNSGKQILTIDEQCILAEFQLKTTISRLMAYESIDWTSNDTIIIERSIMESLKVFIPCQQTYLQDILLYETVRDLTKYLVQYEPKFDQVITLYEDIDVLYERIKIRGRPFEQKITKQYLERLQSYYYQYSQEKIEQKTYSNQVYVMGAIANGKSSFLEQMNSIVKNPQNEQLDFWHRDLLEHHLQNVSQERCDGYTFLFQIRVILSRLAFRSNDSVVERNIVEEQLFIEQYKNCFTKNQYDLLQTIYKYLVDKILRNCTIFFLQTENFEQQWTQLQKRNRKGEQGYTREYLQQLNLKYDKLFQDLMKIKKERKIQIYKMININNDLE